MYDAYDVLHLARAWCRLNMEDEMSALEDMITYHDIHCPADECTTAQAARAELAQLRAADIRTMEHCECGCLLYLDANAPDDAEPYCPVCALDVIRARAAEAERLQAVVSAQAVQLEQAREINFYSTILACAWKYARENGIINSSEYDFYGGDVNGVDFVADEIIAANAPEAEQKRSNGWMPIETAPRNGTEVLGWREDAGVMIVRYTAQIDFMTERELEELSEESAESYDWFYSDFISGGRLEGTEAPTHWMPFPSGPKAEATK